MQLRKIVILFLLIPCGLMAKGNINAYLKIALEFTSNNQSIEAIKVCDKILALDSKHEDALFIRGINYFILKDYDAAIDDFSLLISINEKYPDAYLYRARSRKGKKEYWSAFKDYNKAKDENFSKTLSTLTGDLVKSIFSGDN